MPPVSRPTVPLPPGSWKVPASVPSARSAVRTIVAPGGLGRRRGRCRGGPRRAAAPPRRKPHEPQKRLDGALTWPHCGQMTSPRRARRAAAGAGGRGAGGEREPARARAAGAGAPRRRRRRRRRGHRQPAPAEAGRWRRAARRCAARHAHAAASAARTASAPRRAAARAAAEAELVVVLIVLRALRTGDHAGPPPRRRLGATPEYLRPCRGVKRN